MPVSQRAQIIQVAPRSLRKQVETQHLGPALYHSAGDRDAILTCRWGMGSPAKVVVQLPKTSLLSDLGTDPVREMP